MQPFLALITPIGGGSGAHPEHPWVPPAAGAPPGYWGGVAPPYVDIGFPMPQPPTGRPPVYPAHPIAGGPWPTHPIAGPQPPQQRPPGYWGGVAPPYVDIGGPGPQPTPTPPIYFPPEGAPPPLGIWGPPTMPPGYWGGGMGPGVKPQPKPEHPIVLPPDLPETTPPPEQVPIEWKTAWTPQTGWIVVGIPTVPVPTPSA
jgi:hypothetical protein